MGTIFCGKILKETIVAGTKVPIVPSVEGSAYITQYSEVEVDPEDPFPNGYRVAEIW